MYVRAFLLRLVSICEKEICFSGEHFNSLVDGSKKNEVGGNKRGVEIGLAIENSSRETVLMASSPLVHRA